MSEQNAPPETPTNCGTFQFWRRVACPECGNTGLLTIGNGGDSPGMPAYVCQNCGKQFYELVAHSPVVACLKERLGWDNTGHLTLAWTLVDFDDELWTLALRATWTRGEEGALTRSEGAKSEPLSEQQQTSQSLSEETLTTLMATASPSLWRRVRGRLYLWRYNHGLLTPGERDDLLKEDLAFLEERCDTLKHQRDAAWAELHRLREERATDVLVNPQDSALVVRALVSITYRDWVTYGVGTEAELQRLRLVSAALTPRGDEPNG